MSLVASVAIIASVARITAHGLSIPGGVPGGLSSLLGNGGAARDLLQTTTTESLIHRILRGGNIGFGGRIGAPLGLRTTTTTRRTPRGHITTNPSPARLSTRSAGRSYTRFQDVSTPYTVTLLSSAGTRGVSSGFLDTKTTVQVRQSTIPPDHAGSTDMRVEASVSYETPTTSVPKVPATLEIIPKPPPKNLIGTSSMTTQPSIVPPTFTEHKDHRQPNGQESETPDAAEFTTDTPQDSSVDFHYTTPTYIHQTKVRKRDIHSSTPSSSEAVTETFQTGDITSVDIHVDDIVTDTQTGTESPTYTERIDELTTESFTGGEISFAQATGSSGSGKMTNITEATNTFVKHSSVFSTTDIGENNRTMGLPNADDISTGGTTISRRTIALTNGTFTRPMFDDGAVTIGPRSSAIHPTIGVTTQNNAPGVGTIDGSVATEHPQSMTMPSMMKRDTTVASDKAKATRRDNPPTMTAYSEATHTMLIVGGDTTTSQLITDNDQNSITITDAPPNIKEITPVIEQATTTYSEESGKAITGTNVTTINLRELSTGKATIVASQETETVTILSTSVISRAMSPRVRTQEVDISNEENVVTIEPTVSNDKEDSRFLTYGNGQTNTSDFRGESSTNQQTTTDNEIANDTGNVVLRSATNAYTTRNPVYYSTESYTPTEQRSTHSSVKFDVNSTTSAFETISDSTESTNSITTDSSVHARDNMATRLEIVNKTSISTAYPVTTSKTPLASNTESKRSIPTTTYRTPYAIHLVKPKPSQPMALVTQISTSQDIYGSKTSNSNSETNSVTTRESMTTEEINATTNYTEDFLRNLPEDGIATPSALNTSQSKLFLSLLLGAYPRQDVAAQMSLHNCCLSSATLFAAANVPNIYHYVMSFSHLCLGFHCENIKIIIILHD